MVQEDEEEVGLKEEAPPSRSVSIDIGTVVAEDVAEESSSSEDIELEPKLTWEEREACCGGTPHCLEPPMIPAPPPTETTPGPPPPSRLDDARKPAPPREEVY